ncbi:MAG: metallophosphoesterase [Tyzzerella sp.]|nr:metallophosphoesterase [Tyzzerella sp.]
MTKWLILIGVIVLICIVEWIREIVTFEVTHYNIKSEKLNKLNHERKIVFLSDLHNNHYGKKNEKLLAAVKEQNPDLILIGGDMLVGKADVSSKVAESFVARLTEICPVYYANGNHEQRMKVYPETFGTAYQEYKDRLIKSNVTFIENENVDFNWDGCQIKIHGLEIPVKFYKKFRKQTLPVDVVREQIGKPKADCYNILLAHNPTYTNTYLKWGADLILSGHFHGGVVRIPKLGGIITPQWHMFPKYSGELTEKDGKHVVVSKGLGAHTLKIRFLNPAEVIVLHLNGR